MLAWKCLYPIGIHFAISQVLSYLGMYLLVWRTGADITAYYQQALLLTGLTGILASVPCIWLYRGDYRRRSLTGILGRLGKELTPASISDGRIQDFGAGSGKNVSCSSLIGGHLHIPEMIMFLVIGAFLGQYGNILVGLFQQYLNPEVYQETQSLISDGKSIWSLIFWMGIIAPLAEEIIFRWLVFLRMRDNMRVVTAALLSRPLLWNLPHESAPGRLRHDIGNTFRAASGMEREAVHQCASSHGRKHLEPDRK